MYRYENQATPKERIARGDVRDDLREEHLAEAAHELSRCPAGVIVLELTTANSESLLLRLLEIARRFPRACPVVMAEHGLEPYEWAVREAGAVLGTRGFMSPEQASGTPSEVAPRTDVYGLGGILYMLLTGVPPHGHASGRFAGADVPRRGGEAVDPSSRGVLAAPHHPPRAKRVIYLFMSGGPSQLDLFDYKPELVKRDGQPCPDQFTKGKRFAFTSTGKEGHDQGRRIGNRL